MEQGKPQVIPVKGVSVKEKVVNPDSKDEDKILRFDLDINLDELYNDLKQYRNHNGFAKVQIVKRRKPSPKGHNYYMRIRSAINDAA